jgi:hypothetical protein
MSKIPFGEILLAASVPATTGKYFFVSSSGGSNNHKGTPEKPFATIDYAVGRCTASKGDVIVVMPGHAETISAAAGIALDVAGVTVIGLGAGSLRPTVTLDTSTATDVNVSAANVTIKNIRFVGNIDSLVNFIDIDEEYCTIEDCVFVTSSTKEAVGFINMATTKDNLTIRGCKFLQPTDPAGTDGAADTGAIFLVDSENILIENCEFYGNFETAFIHNRTTACKNLWVKDCRGIQSLSGAEPFQLVDGANGAMLGGGFITPAEVAATEATLVGTIGNSFFVLQPGSFGNDGAAGGQGGIVVTTAS